MEELIKNQKYTEAERHEIYKKVKATFNGFTVCSLIFQCRTIGLCSIFHILGYSIDDFPEIMWYKPIEPLAKTTMPAYWWPLTQEGNQQRKEAIDNCIEKTKQKPKECQNQPAHSNVFISLLNAEFHHQQYDCSGVINLTTLYDHIIELYKKTHKS